MIKAEKNNDFYNHIKKRYKDVPTPCYIVEEELLERNLKKLKKVINDTGCKILLAQKAFSMYHTYPLIGKYLCGTTASGLYEAKLGYEEMSGEVHIYNPAYKETDMDEIVSICDHIVFNSFEQWARYKATIKKARESGKHIECGIRINPEYAEVETDIYNPCSSGSRLGTTIKNFKEDLLEGIDGLHFHAMCEQNSDVLKRILNVVELKFGKYLHQMKWLNFGGGHHITKENYNLDILYECIQSVKNKYDIQVYLEPGESIALDAGFLVSEVLDIIHNEADIAIMDTSAACHMPDVLEMPYRPHIIGAGEPLEKRYTYRLGGPTCLAGDIIGSYSFDEPLKAGDKLIFCDMAIYSMCKNNTFNGMPLPHIMYGHKNGSIEIVKEFMYEDFKRRL